MPGAASGCVLFADVSGSTRLNEMVGDKAAHEAIDLCLKLLAALTEQHGGRVARRCGGEVMAIFDRAGDAARAAVDIQLGMSEMAPVDKARLGVRVGMHFGPVEEREGEVFGDTVNLAARLTEMASRGQIVTSLETVQRLEPIQRLDCRTLYDLPARGAGQDVAVCEVLWTDADDLTQLVSSRAATDGTDKLRIVYRGRVLDLGEANPSLVIGRDPASGLVVPERMASRTHCVIERRLEGFVLTDRSANGTYLSIDGEREAVLRRESSALRNHGHIALGQPRATAAELIEFFCE
jgi:adenylate cyclase